MFLLQGEEVVRQIPHLCKPDFERNKIAISISKLKNKASTSNKPIPKLYNKELKRFIVCEGTKSVQNFPALTQIQHSLYEIRNKASCVNRTVFTNLEDVQIPAQFHQMVLADYFYEGNRILMFCTPEARQMLYTVKEFFVDATFKACPQPFKELVSIHGDIGSSTETTRVVPFIFALLSSKKQSAYETMYDIIKSCFPQFQPATLHCDFEIAHINALLLMFPGINIVGCYYHWHRCLWRKANLLLGRRRCKAENRIVSLCAALALLPREMIKEGWSYIKSESLVIGTDFQKFLRYVEKTWLKEKYLNVLSVFGMQHRTNNVLEGYHSKLNKFINKNTKTIMRLLSFIKDDSLVKIVGKRFIKRNRRLVINDDSIQNIQIQLINGEISIGFALEKLR